MQIETMSHVKTCRGLFFCIIISHGLLMSQDICLIPDDERIVLKKEQQVLLFNDIAERKRQYLLAAISATIVIGAGAYVYNRQSDSKNTQNNTLPLTISEQAIQQQVLHQLLLLISKQDSSKKTFGWYINKVCDNALHVAIITTSMSVVGYIVSHGWEWIKNNFLFDNYESHFIKIQTIFTAELQRVQQIMIEFFDNCSLINGCNDPAIITMSIASLKRYVYTECQGFVHLAENMLALLCFLSEVFVRSKEHTILYDFDVLYNGIKSAIIAICHRFHIFLSILNINDIAPMLLDRQIFINETQCLFHQINKGVEVCESIFFKQIT